MCVPKAEAHLETAEPNEAVRYAWKFFQEMAR
jgi:hypothetical protein